MTTPNTPSGRCSARVVSPGPAPTVAGAVGHESAPGSLTDQVRPASPERAGRPAPAHQHNRASGGTQRAQAERLQDQLSPRDQAVLLTLDAHRFLSTHQLQRFHFHEHTTHGAASRICRRVLHRLHELGVIDHLDRRVGGVRAGSASYVWRVGLIGHQLLHLNTTAGDRPRPRRKEPSLRWLQHCLAVADTHLALLDLARADHLELLQVQTEPSCWRHYLGSGGNRETLKPDLYAVTAGGDYEDHWFCELDRATESLPTLLSKCAQYQHYRRSGSEQQGGGVFPLVVWIVPDDIRAAKLTSAIRSSRSLDAGLYRVCTPDSFPAVISGGAA